MKICFINPTIKIRSDLESLLSALPKEFKVVVFTPKKSKEFEKLDNIEIRTFPALFIPKIRYTITDFISQYKILRNFIKKERPDIIHIISYEYLTSIVPTILSKKYRIKNFVNVDSFPGISWNYGSIFISFFAKIYTKTLGLFVLNKNDKIILIGNYLKRDAKRLGIENIKVIHNAFNPRVCDMKNVRKIKKEFGIKKGETVIINVCRLVKVKGVEKTIESSKILLKKGYKIKTLIVGDGPNEKKYKKLASGNENIIFTGYRKDITNLLGASDIFLMTSISEGLPLSLIEASFYKKPIVVSDVGGCSEIVKEGFSGFLVRDYKNSLEFVKKLEFLLKNPNIRQKMGENAYSYVKNRFSTKKLSNKLLKLYIDSNEQKK